MSNIVDKMRRLLAVLESAGRVPDTWQKIQPCDVILQLGDGGRNYAYRGKAYHSLWNSMGDLFAERGYIVRTVSDYPDTKLVGALAYNEPISCNRALVFGILQQKAIEFIASKKVAAEWAKQNGIVHLWRRIFEKARPRCVIGNMPSSDLCRAGKMMDVPIYDLQHGVITDQHYWYGESFKADTPASDIPDGYLCWDEVSAKTLRKWAPQKGIDVRVIGNPWFLRFLLPKQGDQLVEEALKEARLFNNNKPIILVTLQWGLREECPDEVPNGVMVDALEKTILQTTHKYNWLLRLHQVQLMGNEKPMVHNYLERTFAQIPSVEWSKCSVSPLPALLNQAALHITFHSSVIIEAGWMGVRSALLAKNLFPGGTRDNYYAHERNLGLATVLPQDVDVIKHWIEENIGKERMPSTLVDHRNSLQEFIDEIMSK